MRTMFIACMLMMMTLAGCGGDPLPPGATACVTISDCQHYECCAGIDCPESVKHPAGTCRSVQDNFSE